MDQNKGPFSILWFLRCMMAMQYSVTIRRGNIYSTIQCDGYSFPIVVQALKAVEEKTKFRSQGYEFTKAYKEGWWDGFIRVVNASDKKVFGVPAYGFYTGYMRDVVGEFMRAGIEINATSTDSASEIREDERRTWPWNDEKFRLHDYQERTIDLAVEKSRGIIQLATGAGKGVVAAALVHRLGMAKVVVFVTTKDLLYQAKKRFEAAMPGVPIGIIGDGVCDIHDITICTIQSCSRAYGTTKVYDKELKQMKSIMDFDPGKEAEIDESKSVFIRELIETARVVIFDEIHRSPSDMCRSVLEMTKNAKYRYGLGATVKRDDNMDNIIRGLFGDVIIHITASELIRRGFLIQPRIFMLGVRSGSLHYSSYQEEYKKCVEENHERNSTIVNIAKNMASNNKPTLILIKHINHGNRLMEMLGKDSGFVFVTGKESAKKRESAFTGILDGSIKGVVASSLADEGLDLPNLECLILAGAGKSQTSVYQRIGRVIRLHPQGLPKDAFVYDFMDSSNYMSAQSRRRMALYRCEPEFKIEIIEN